MMKHTLFCVVAALAAMAPANAAYCGAPADTKTLEKLAVAHWNGKPKIDKTYILSIDVVGNWAQVAVTYEGEALEYFNKTGGTWKFARYSPQRLPRAIRKTMDARQYGCKNPKFVNHGASG